MDKYTETILKFYEILGEKQFKSNEKEITWIDGFKHMIDGRIVKVVHGREIKSIYHFRKNSGDEFQMFDIDTYTFTNGYIDADDITEGKWYLIRS